MTNEYIPFPSKIMEVIQHTDIEYTFRMAYDGVAKPGQFFEVSLPKYGEAPISVSGIGDGLIDFTIRKVRMQDFGIMGMTLPQFDPNRCISCGACVKKCEKKSVTALTLVNFRPQRDGAN